jgi:hypothetical protein
MRKTTQHLDDEHMRLYEWSGAGMGCHIPAKSKRTHPWHASYSVLAVMTSLLILNGCNTQSPAERVVEDMKIKGETLYEEAMSKPVPTESPEAAGYAMDEASAEQPAR